MSFGGGCGQMLLAFVALLFPVVMLSYALGQILTLYLKDRHETTMHLFTKGASQRFLQVVFSQSSTCSRDT